MLDSPFRLASVLAYREVQLDQAVQEAAAIEGKLRSLLERRAAILSARRTSQDRAVPVAEVLAAELWLVAEYLEGLEDQEARLGREIARVEAELSGSRARVVTRHQEVSALRRLRERHGAAVRQATARREQLALDEIAGLQAERRRHA